MTELQVLTPTQSVVRPKSPEIRLSSPRPMLSYAALSLTVLFNHVLSYLEDQASRDRDCRYKKGAARRRKENISFRKLDYDFGNIGYIIIILYSGEAYTCVCFF